MSSAYITGTIETSAGPLPLITTAWSSLDTWNTLKVRWSIGRTKYRVEPGIYAVGNPDRDSRVFVTCNYKLGLYPSGVVTLELDASKCNGC
jgi:CO dehydrogenase/acetyl-CoA synthase gamma subunit (corrinoid Fe-S protein)